MNTTTNATTNAMTTTLTTKTNTSPMNTDAVPSTGRIQLALNVSNIDEAVDFYTKLFGVGPAKRRDGYANFAVAHPPLKLVLIQGEGLPGTMNHLGVEVESSEIVRSEIERLANAGLTERIEENTTCCFAVQDKVWVTGPDGEPWEVYTVKADAEVMHETQSACCTPDASVAPSTIGVALTEKAAPLVGESSQQSSQESSTKPATACC